LLLLVLLHAMVGDVELGTDSRIVNIMEKVIQGQAFRSLIYTSSRTSAAGRCCARPSTVDKQH